MFPCGALLPTMRTMQLNISVPPGVFPEVFEGLTRGLPQKARILRHHEGSGELVVQCVRTHVERIQNLVLNLCSEAFVEEDGA